jgi:hypothetical protein
VSSELDKQIVFTLTWVDLWMKREKGEVESCVAECRIALEDGEDPREDSDGEQWVIAGQIGTDTSAHAYAYKATPTHLYLMERGAT